jgi:ABC-type arginine transport system permease subunit
VFLAERTRMAGKAYHHLLIYYFILARLFLLLSIISSFVFINYMSSIDTVLNTRDANSRMRQK